MNECCPKSQRTALAEQQTSKGRKGKRMSNENENQ